MAPRMQSYQGSYMLGPERVQDYRIQTHGFIYLGHRRFGKQKYYYSPYRILNMIKFSLETMFMSFQTFL
jgi:hypothetical protein